METPPAAADAPSPGRTARDRAGGELRRARAVAHILDNLLPIPGTSWRVGLDPLVGLLPGVGDWIGWVASLHLLVTGARAGADGATLVRMAGNLLVDAVVGAVPLLGDLFDVAWKANERNLRLLEETVAAPGATRRASRGVVAAVLGGTVVVLGGASVAAILLLRWVVGVVTGAV